MKQEELDHLTAYFNSVNAKLERIIELLEENNRVCVDTRERVTITGGQMDWKDWNKDEILQAIKKDDIEYRVLSDEERKDLEDDPRSTEGCP